MGEEGKTTVLDISDNPKNAALYFDYVMPFNSQFLFGYIFASDVEKSPFDIYPLPLKITELYSILPLKMQHRKSARLAYIKFLLSIALDDKPEDKKVAKDYGLKYYEDLNDFLKEYDINKCDVLYESNCNLECIESYECTSLNLAQLPLIDTAKTEWEQILEFREDKDSVNKLRRLKLFFHENYSGKEKNYVQDDLSKRLEDYELAVKDWGFATVTSSISMLLTSPLTLTSVGTSLAMALFGEPLRALATAGTGVGLEIGKMSLHIAKEKKKLSVLQRDHPLAYIIDAKKQLE